MDIIESFGTAICHLNDALLKVEDAQLEVGKWRHPVEAEIAGISWNITRKIIRLEELKKWMETENH